MFSRNCQADEQVIANKKVMVHIIMNPFGKTVLIYESKKASIGHATCALLLNFNETCISICQMVTSFFPYISSFSLVLFIYYLMCLYSPKSSWPSYLSGNPAALIRLKEANELQDLNTNPNSSLTSFVLQSSKTI